MPTFGRPQLLDAALGSIAAQDLRSDIEVIVVNDAGTSVTSVVRAWGAVMTVRLVELDRHSGSAAARNVGIEHADGKYIAFLDDDDLFMPGHLATGSEPLERGEADFVYLGAVVADQRLSSPLPDTTGFRLKSYPTTTGS